MFFFLDEGIDRVLLLADEGSDAGEDGVIMNSAHELGGQPCVQNCQLVARMDNHLANISVRWNRTLQYREDLFNRKLLESRTKVARCCGLARGGVAGIGRGSSGCLHLLRKRVDREARLTTY